MLYPTKYLECSYSHTPFLKDNAFKQFHNGLYVIKSEFTEHGNLKQVNTYIHTLNSLHLSCKTSHFRFTGDLAILFFVTDVLCFDTC